MHADWNPALYARFTDLRLRPALDLLAQVGDLPDGNVIDLGCGAGAVGPALRARFPDRQLVGLDNSPAMLAEAEGTYDALIDSNIADWQPETPPALIFSNAALQWTPDHPTLLPQLAGLLAPGGWLAVQMPRQEDRPSHRLLQTVAHAVAPDLVDLALPPPRVLPAADYWRLLEPLGTVQAWETDYVQHLPAPADGHPVRAFTASTAMRPWADRLGPTRMPAFLAAYDAALETAYPRLPDGGALMPFIRVFLTLRT